MAIQQRMKSTIGLVVMIITVPLIIEVTADVSANPNAPALAVTTMDFIPVVYVLGILWLAADGVLGTRFRRALVAAPLDLVVVCVAQASTGPTGPWRRFVTRGDRGRVSGGWC